MRKLWLTVLRAVVGASVLELLLFIVYLPSVLVLLVIAGAYLGVFAGLYSKNVTFAAKSARALAFFLFPASSATLLGIVYGEESGGAAPIIWIGLTALTQLAIIVAASELIGGPAPGDKKDDKRKAQRRKQTERFLGGFIVVAVFIIVGRMVFPGGITDPGNRAAYWAVRALEQARFCLSVHRGENPAEGYPQSLDAIGATGSGCLTDDLVDQVNRYGYDLSYTPAGPDTDGLVLNFSLLATRNGNEPGAPGNYFLDWNGKVRFTSDDRNATANDPPIP